MNNLAAFKLRRLTTPRRFLILGIATLAVNAQSIVALAQGDVSTAVSTAVTASGGMSGQAILTVSASIVALTQLLKWSKVVSDQRGPLLVLALALFGVAFWGWATGDISRASAFGYFAGWISVATSAAGIYGFTRSGPESITATSTPPSGAGASPTN